MANPIAAADKFIQARLLASAALTAIVGTRIRAHRVADTVPYPLVLYTLAGSPATFTTVEENRIWDQLVYAVRIIDRVESFMALEAGAEAIYQALHKTQGSNSSGTITACVYQAPYYLIEIGRDGYEVRSLGGLYRPFVQ